VYLDLLLPANHFREKPLTADKRTDKLRKFGDCARRSGVLGLSDAIPNKNQDARKQLEWPL
jgi:hypothetical protein